MKMNSKMAELLRRLNIPAASDDWVSLENSSPVELTTADGSVLLKSEYGKSKHVKPSHFPDKTGYEAFVNHVHFPFDGKRESLLRCLSYASAITRKLAPMNSRRFHVIVSVGDNCTVRFHEVRPGEIWLTEDLELYAEEAVLLLHAGSA
jgi:hypothetical protein